MLRIEIQSPDLEKEVNALIGVGLYPDSHTLIIDALEKLVNNKKNPILTLQFNSIKQGK